MSVRPEMITQDKQLSPAVREFARLPEALPAVERIGLLAIIHSPSSQRIPFKYGAEGHTAAQLHLVGEQVNREVMGESLGQVSVTLPDTEGNLLIVPRAALIDTCNDLSRYSDYWSTPFNGTNLTLALMKWLALNKVNDERYDACVSYFNNPVTGQEEVVCATADSNAAMHFRLRLPTTQG